MSLASGGSSGTRSTRASVITDRKSLSRRYSAVLRVYTVYTWPTEFVVAGVVSAIWDDQSGRRAPCCSLAPTRQRAHVSVLSHMQYGSRYVAERLMNTAQNGSSSSSFTLNQ